MIDFGQSIDMRQFPKNQVFHSKIKTENFICTEMLDNRPWSYQHDIFCLASTIFTMLCGKYMNLLKRKRLPGYDTQTIPRYYNKRLWTGIFDRLINQPDVGKYVLLEELHETLRADIVTQAPNSAKDKITTFNTAIEQDV